MCPPRYVSHILGERKEARGDVTANVPRVFLAQDDSSGPRQVCGASSSICNCCGETAPPRGGGKAPKGREDHGPCWWLYPLCSRSSPPVVLGPASCYLGSFGALSDARPCLALRVIIFLLFIAGWLHSCAFPLVQCVLMCSPFLFMEEYTHHQNDTDLLPSANTRSRHPRTSECCCLWRMSKLRFGKFESKRTDAA